MTLFLWYAFPVGLEWTPSSGKHGVSRQDVLWAMTHAEGEAIIEGRPGWITRVFVGHPHPQTDRYIEVIAATNGTDFVIFHAMPLTDIYRHLIQDKE